MVQSTARLQVQTDAAAVVKTMNYTLADGKMTDSENAGSVNIAKAGTYTVTVKVGEHSDLTYTIESGNQTAPEPEASNTLCMFSKDGNSPSCRDEQGERWCLYLQI